MKRLGILTGGGDAPGLNAVIRAVVKTAANELECEVIGIEDGYDGLVLNGTTRPLTVNEARPREERPRGGGGDRRGGGSGRPRSGGGGGRDWRY